MNLKDSIKYKLHFNPFKPANTFESRVYQDKIVKFLAYTPKSILFAGMSSGKTMMIIRRAIQVNGLTIVICPAAVKGSWLADMKQFNINFPFLSLDGTAKQNVKSLNELPSNFKGIIVVSYAMARSLFLNEYRKKDLVSGFNLERLQPDYVVLDECHKVGGHVTKQTQALTYMFRETPLKTVMTGTLFHDSLEKIWSITRFLFPVYPSKRSHARCDLDGMQSTFEDFLTRYFHTYRKGYHIFVSGVKKKTFDELAKILKPYMYILKTEDVVELPKEVINKVTIELEKQTKKAYKDIESTFVTELDGSYVITSNALTSLGTLQQLTCNGTLMDTDGNVKKFGIKPRLAYMQNYFEVNEHVPKVIFYKYRADYKILSNMLDGANIPYATLNGSLKNHEQFIEGKVKTVLVNIASGSTGVRLSKCGNNSVSQVLVYSFDWSNADFSQALMRVRRSDNEHDTVFITVLLSEGIETDMFNELIVKSKNSDKMDKALLDATTTDD